MVKTITHITEMEKVIKLLKIFKVPFELTDDVMGNTLNQLWYPNQSNAIYDVICHEYSYGGEEGLLEIMDRENEEVKGWLTAEDVFFMISTHYLYKAIEKKRKEG